ncbi:uncharacterized protein L969DRAFT_49598 [Mixia osmundae IAM 14324]|uniref:Uncharacterized protein n=1 Tax=Mixia osmundae (strain CBS 9802 / IAM 14324 / JCM 22182 / KY 12970) TaxID=764103 RepID=G7DVV3_MIXOS|nr:uncharacterized protein L969DRAFT_49598 [Mixia osmundae IAM 14324]KEI39608.1 hypothetical protein L969DRAFT_49598 [Mixia osmundae IAM 14324]GAA94713.1 hypothetical protein E5Q_01366 [Mixia osmundae IAM 14324]
MRDRLQVAQLNHDKALPSSFSTNTSSERVNPEPKTYIHISCRTHIRARSLHESLAAGHQGMKSPTKLSQTPLHTRQ